MQFFLYSLSSFTRANVLEQKRSLYPIARQFTCRRIQSILRIVYLQKNSEQSPNSFLLLLCPRFSCEKQAQNLFEYKTTKYPFEVHAGMRNKSKGNSRWEDWHNTRMRRLAPVIEANKVLYIRHLKCLNKLLPPCSTLSVQSQRLLGSQRSFCLSVCVVKTKRLTTGNWII